MRLVIGARVITGHAGFLAVVLGSLLGPLQLECHFAAGMSARLACRGGVVEALSKYFPTIPVGAADESGETGASVDPRGAACATCSFRTRVDSSSETVFESYEEPVVAADPARGQQ